MIDYDRFIKSLGKCYQLHIQAVGISPENLHHPYKTLQKFCIQLLESTTICLKLF